MKKNFAIGKLLQVIKPSEQRVEPPCKYYWKCGGCQLQHMTYDAQLAMKQSQVTNLFHRKAQFSNTIINKTIGMDHPWHYRNKSQLPIGKDRDGKAIIGYYRQRSHDIIDMDSCLIQDDVHQDIMNHVKQWIIDYDISVYNEVQKGLLRHLVIRTGYYSDDKMVVFVTNGKNFQQASILVEKLKETFPNITSIKQNINKSHSNVIMGNSL